MAELKPCPFCGGKANIDGGNGIVKRYFVFCTKCKTKQENRLTREEAIEAWNRVVAMVVSLPNRRKENDNGKRRNCNIGIFWFISYCSYHNSYYDI